MEVGTDFPTDYENLHIAQMWLAKFAALAEDSSEVPYDWTVIPDRYPMAAVNQTELISEDVVLQVIQVVARCGPYSIR